MRIGRLSRRGTGGAERRIAEFEHGKNRVKDLPCSSPDPRCTRPALLRPRRPCGSSQPIGRAGSFSDDFKLFATTFVAGFLFVSILIG